MLNISKYALRVYTAASAHRKHSDEPYSLVFPVILTESFKELRITWLHLCLVQEAQESTGHVHDFVNVLEHSIQITQWGLQEAQ